MPHWPPLSVLSISHRKTDLGLRERFARSGPEVVALLAGEEGPRRYGVVLSTCNRFEVYWWGDRDWPVWVRSTASQLDTPLHPNALISRCGHDALRHLFRVTAGLDSQVVGETEIQGQVRRAWGLAREVGATCRELDVVFASALAAGRRIRHESGLGRHAGSVGAVAVTVALAELGGTLSGRSVGVVGAGQAARGVAAALSGTGALVGVVSRRIERAGALASRYGGEALPWEALDALLAGADLVFTATAAPQPLVSPDRLRATRNGAHHPLLLVDLGVPRNVEPEVAALPNLRVLDLDDLRVRAPEATGELTRTLQAAEQVLDAEVGCLAEKLGGVVAGRRLAELHRAGARLVEDEVASTLARLPHLTDEDREVIRQMARRLVRRALHPASRTLKVSAASPAKADSGG